MQNIYIGSQQIHSNTTDLGFVVEIPVEGFEFPSIRLAQYNKPGEHGAIVTNQFYGGRPFALNGRVSGNTITQYQQNRRLLSAALGIIQDTLAVAQPITVKFLTMDGLSLQTDSYVSDGSPIVFKEKSLNHASFRIQLFAPDPNFYNQSQQNVSFGIPTGGGVTYPVIYPVSYAAQTGGQQTVVNNGDAATFPAITFYGPLTTPYILNITTGQTFIINRTLVSGDILVVDMANKTMLLNGITNALQFFTTGNSWIYLTPGNNVIRLGSSLSADTGSAVISYRDAYLGI